MIGSLPLVANACVQIMTSLVYETSSEEYVCFARVGRCVQGSSWRSAAKAWSFQSRGYFLIRMHGHFSYLLMGDDADMWQPEPGETPAVTREREVGGLISAISVYWVIIAI